MKKETGMNLKNTFTAEVSPEIFLIDVAGHRSTLAGPHLALEGIRIANRMQELLGTARTVPALASDALGDDAENRLEEAVWGAHLTEHERADPALGRARDWLQIAVSGAHAWARAHRSPLTPDQLCAALEAGTGQQVLANQNRPGAILPRLLDLHVWAALDGVTDPWALDLDATLRATPGFDPARALTGQPQPDVFRRAAQDRMRLTLSPIRDLIDDVRNEPDPS